MGSVRPRVAGRRSGHRPGSGRPDGGRSGDGVRLPRRSGCGDPSPRWARVIRAHRLAELAGCRFPLDHRPRAAETAQAAVADVADLPAEPRIGPCRARLVHDSHGDVPGALRVGGAATRPSAPKHRTCPLPGRANRAMRTIIVNIRWSSVRAMPQCYGPADQMATDGRAFRRPEKSVVRHIGHRHGGSLTMATRSALSINMAATSGIVTSGASGSSGTADVGRSMNRGR